MKRISTALVLTMLFTPVFAAADLGETTYEIACKNCHAPQFSTANKAPAAFDKEAWADRFKKAEAESKNNPSRYKTAMDYLVYKVKIGKGLMYHGGLCNEANVKQKNCSDDAFAAAIRYMSEKK